MGVFTKIFLNNIHYGNVIIIPARCIIIIALIVPPYTYDFVDIIVKKPDSMPA